MAETITYLPDQNQANNVLPWMLASQNNGFFGGSGGNAFLGGLIGGAAPWFLGALSGNGFFGNRGTNSDAAAAAALGAQATANSNMDTMLRAVDGTDADVRALASSLNTDIASVTAALNSLALQEAVSVPQLINSIQSGNTTLLSKLGECCCENRLLTTQQGYESRIATIEQTNALGGAISGASQREVDAIADLKTTMVKEFCDARERDMQADIDRKAETITQLRGQIDNANQTAAITGYINSLVSPIAKEVDDIKCKMPNTVPVTWPNLAAVNTTPYVSGGYYQGGFNGLYGSGVPGFGGGIYF